MKIKQIISQRYTLSIICLSTLRAGLRYIRTWISA